jgi:tRNA A-37 threonylcarbamoyl transferase component Bud32
MFSSLASPQSTEARYQELARIGRGGMAEVFLAVVRGAAVSKLVVLKRIWPELASDPTFAAMFLDEARLSVRMSHPNVVQTYEVSDQDGRMTIAMEYLDGQPLSKVLNRLTAASGMAELTLALRLRIVIEILAGLAHVHELTDYDGRPLGVVHRDVSPHNVFITYDGHVKLVDFGVAKMVAASQETRPGTIKGKLAYMAPDQLRAAPIDHRADLFSVGVILWELLAGRRMWQGMTDVTIVRHLSYGLPLPPLPLMAGLLPGLEAICLKALAMNPDDRYASAGEMEAELQGLLPDLQPLGDSHPRHIGRLVSMVFASERAERQAMIEAKIEVMAGRPAGGGLRPGDGWRATGPSGPATDPEASGQGITRGAAAGAPPTAVAESMSPAAGRPSTSLTRFRPPAQTASYEVIVDPGSRRDRRRRWWWWTLAGTMAGGALALLVLPGPRRLGPIGALPSQTSVAGRATRPPARPPLTMAMSGAMSGQGPGSPMTVPIARDPRAVVVEAVARHRLRTWDPDRGRAANAGESALEDPATPSPRSRRGAGAHDLSTGGRRWAWRGEADTRRSLAVDRAGAGEAPGADAFSVELGEPPPPGHRRELDTESPFRP